MGIFYHPDFANRGYTTLRHRVKPGFDALQPWIREQTVQVFEPRLESIHLELLQRTHSAGHIRLVNSEGYHYIALLSAAGVVEAATRLAAGELEAAFCFVGTAGHHAGRHYSWGFCYYNDVVMAVARLQDLGIKRILILDMDPHSGDGTRDLVAHDPQIVHLNFFADEEYAYTDHQRCNYGIKLDNATDHKFLSALEEVLPYAREVEYVIIIFGHDSHCEDYGDFYLTIEGYRRLTQRMKEFAQDRPLLYVLSGGSLPHVAAQAIPAVIQALLE